MFKIIGADQKEYGPISAEQIRQWIVEGRLNAQTPAQRAAGGEWRPLSGFEEFADLAPGGVAGQAPAAGIPAGQAAPISGAPAVEKPPGAIKVFGILNIVFGALALACSPFSLITLPMARRQLGYSSFMVNWMIVSVVIGMIGGAIMLASGIGLCKRQAWARRLAIYYSCAACVLALINPIITLTNLPEGGANPEAQKMGALFGAFFGVIIGLAYNGLLIYFLSRPAVKRSLGETPSVSAPL